MLGRAADPGGLATYQGILAQGGTLATVRQDLAQSPEAARVVQSFYQVSFGRAASADEVTGMQFALGLSISDTDTFALYNTQNQPLAVTGAGNLLTRLPVAVTLDNGVTPLLTVPGGGSPAIRQRDPTRRCPARAQSAAGPGQRGVAVGLSGDGGLAGADRPADAASAKITSQNVVGIGTTPDEQIVLA